MVRKLEDLVVGARDSVRSCESVIVDLFLDLKVPMSASLLRPWKDSAAR